MDDMFAAIFRDDRKLSRQAGDQFAETNLVKKV
jgi:hypothetical protein